MEKGKGFKAHQITNAHKEAVARYIQHKPSDTSSIDHQMNRSDYGKITEITSTRECATQTDV